MVLSWMSSCAHITDTIDFAKQLMKNGVTYVGYGVNFDEEILQNFERQSLILFFTSRSKSEDPQRWIKNNQVFFQQVLKGTKGWGYFAVDCDIYPERLPENTSSCVQVMKSGKVVTKDLLMEQAKVSKIAYALLLSGTKKILHKPNKRVHLHIPCTGNTCNSRQLYTWNCDNCRTVLEYGFDAHVYCDCGQTLAHRLEFKCTDENHGPMFEAHDSDHLTELLGTLRPFKEMNILLLGETGVGKSTWINAFKNFIFYNSLEEAEQGDLLNLIPSEFTVCNEDFEQITVHTGTDENEAVVPGQSSTQGARIYEFNFGNNVIRLIDTPGIADTRGVDQDKKNLQNILTTIDQLEELHGICILLKPNSARLNLMFRFCIKELLTNLHRDASKNIVFCFTNSRGTFYRPGETLPALRTLLKQNKDVDIQIAKDTIYCFDSEAYRFLAAAKNNPPVTFPEDEKENFRKSWEKSNSETMRLLRHVNSLPPHPIQNMLNLIHAREMVIKLTRPLAEISRNIHTNKTIVEKHTEEIKATQENIKELKKNLMIPRARIELTDLEYPKTVCTHHSCVKISAYDDLLVAEYVTVCHDKCGAGKYVPRNTAGVDSLWNCRAFNIWGKCKEKKCRHSHLDHMLVYYDSKQVVDRVEDEAVKKLLEKNTTVADVKQKILDRNQQLVMEYEEELQVIQSASVHFAYFLKINSITPYNDEMQQYLDHLIREEKHKVAEGGSRRTLDYLENSLRMYQVEKGILEEAMEKGDGKNLDISEIDQHLIKLRKLKHTGKQLEEALEVFTRSAEKVYQASSFVSQPSPPPSSVMVRTWNWIFKSRRSVGVLK